MINVNMTLIHGEISVLHSLTENMDVCWTTSDFNMKTIDVLYIKTTKTNGNVSTDRDKIIILKEHYNIIILSPVLCLHKII